MDGGGTWDPIVENYSAASYCSECNYNCDIPNTPSELALIKIEDAQDITKYDVSDNNFVITPTIELPLITGN